MALRPTKLEAGFGDLAASTRQAGDGMRSCLAGCHSWGHAVVVANRRGRRREKTRGSQGVRSGLVPLGEEGVAGHLAPWSQAPRWQG